MRDLFCGKALTVEMHPPKKEEQKKKVCLFLSCTERGRKERRNEKRQGGPYDDG